MKSKMKQTNENDDVTYLNLGNAAKAIVKVKLITSQAYVKNKISNK